MIVLLVTTARGGGVITPRDYRCIVGRIWGRGNIMDFSFTQEQLALKQRIIEFANKELNDDVVQRDKRGIFSRELWQKCGNFGLLGLNAPTAFGGMGADPLTTALAVEALGYACADNGLVFGVCAQLTSMLPTIMDFANAAQKQRYLAQLAKGEIIACYCMTEEATGSDAYALRTVAEKRGDGYVLNGEKWFVTFGPVADIALVYATTNPKAGKWGVSLFIAQGFRQ